VMLVFLGLLVLFTKMYAEFWYKVFVKSKFEIINLLMTSGEVPLSWRLKYLEKSGISALVKKWYIFRLCRMIMYIKRSSLINDQDKQEYVKSFKKILMDWKNNCFFIDWR